MYILTLKTDTPDAEVGLYNNSQQLSYITWAAHRQLAETIHLKIAEILQAQKLRLADLNGIVVFKGPGSFTGLRIGITVANAFSDSLGIPIIGSTADNWIQVGIDRLQQGRSNELIIPEYGALPHITAPRK